MPLIQYLSKIHFDFGAIGQLASELQRLGINRPLLVTDKGIAAAGILEQALDAARPVSPVVYDGTTENPTETSLEACMALWREEVCDGVVAVGGGSSIDLAKAVALLTSHGGRFSDYNVKSGGSAGIGRVSPHIAIPTAAGTGAEVGRACVITTHDGRKTVAVNLNMVADVILCDPDLSLSLPPDLTAATGIDALSHGMETTMSPWINPPAAAIALDCVRRAARWLPVAVDDGSNRKARWEMMMAALEGGMCLQKGLGGAHAMANPLGEHGYRHGELIGILLPHVLRFNVEAARPEISRLAAEVGVSVPEDLADWVAVLVERIGLPGKLSSCGVAADLLPQIAKKAAIDHLAATNPRTGSVDDYLGLLQAAH